MNRKSWVAIALALVLALCGGALAQAAGIAPVLASGGGMV